jgi:hypothetical protein
MRLFAFEQHSGESLFTERLVDGDTVFVLRRGQERLFDNAIFAAFLAVLPSKRLEIDDKLASNSR